MSIMMGVWSVDEEKKKGEKGKEKELPLEREKMMTRLFQRKH